MTATRAVNFIILVLAADFVFSAIFNDTLVDNNAIDTRRSKKKKDKKVRSTSSDSRARRSESGSSSENSLDMTTDSSSSLENNKTKSGIPKSSVERRGWRKWHRKCTPCPEDMRLKWRDPAIKWICGGYQRARRSFKSLCMMHYRNCQDGTMFIKIGDYRCKNDSERDGWRFGEHFFYEYDAKIRDDKSKTGSASTSSQENSFESTS